MLVPVNKVVAATVWGLGFYSVSVVVLGVASGAWFGYQIARGNTSPETMPGMDVIVAVGNYGPVVVGLIALLLSIVGYLPAIYLERKAE